MAAYPDLAVKLAKSKYPTPFSAAMHRFKIVQTYKRIGKIVLPYLCLFLYSVLGASLIYATDSIAPQNGTLPLLCVHEAGFWGALYYVNTIYTTIGYGSVIVCNGWSRLATVLLSFIGIPLFLVVLDSLGKIICESLRLTYIQIVAKSNLLTRYRKVPTNPEKDAYATGVQFVQIPLHLSISITVLWTLLSAVYFHYTEAWHYSDALYFTFVSVTTIGFGDFAPAKLELTFISFAFFAIGLSLVSTTIHVVQQNIHALIEKLHVDIEREYQRKLQHEAEHPYLAQLEDIETPEEALKRLIKKNGADFLAHLLPRTQLTEVVSQISKRAESHSANTQTDVVPATEPLKPQIKDQATHYEPPNFITKHAVVVQRFNSVDSTSMSARPPPQPRTVTTASQCDSGSVVVSSGCQTDSWHDYVVPAIESLQKKQTEDKAISARPSTRTVYLQSPRWGAYQ